jgi:hypothetical protein
MPAVKLNSFGGMIPASDDRLLPETMAADALNTWLYAGRLEGIPEPRLVHTCSLSNTKKVFRIPTLFTDNQHIGESFWMEFIDQDTDVLKGPMANDIYNRYYWTSATTGPQYNSLTRIRTAYAPLTLGVPYPLTFPTVTVTGGSSTTMESRSYLFTWVTEFGEEGAPSAPMVVSGKVDATWTIGLTAPTTLQQTGRLLDKVRIYRTVTASTGNSTYFFVAELPLSTTSYVDDQANAVVSGNDQLQSTLWTPPPTDLRGFSAMPNGMIVGFRANEIWFCEPYRPHAWPTTYTLSVDFPIIGLGVTGQTVIVCTQGSTYAVTGIAPETATMAKISTREPCMSRGSILSSPQGVVYASPNGLILCAAGQVVNATQSLLSKDKWQEYFDAPRIRAAQLGTGYYSFGGISTGCFDTSAFNTSAFEIQDFTGARDGSLVDLSDQRVAFTRLYNSAPTVNVFNDVWTNEALVLRDNKVYQIDLSAGRPRSEYTWRSKRFQMTNKRNMEAMKIYFDNPEALTNFGTVKVYADDRLVMTRAINKSGELIRLPSGFKAEFWQFEVTSKVPLSSIQAANSVKELSNV